MLKLYDRNHNEAGFLVNYKDLRVDSDLDTADKTLTFTLLDDTRVESEQYILTEDDEYIVKEVNGNTNENPEVVCALNLEELEKDAWSKYNVTEVTIDEAARPVLAGTGWTVGTCDVTKVRSAGMADVNSREVLVKLATAFMCDLSFDTRQKKVNFHLKRGDDKGVYFIAGLNLRKLSKKESSYDFYTRIVPYGANGLTIESVNNGNNFLENHQYSDKVLTYIWKDESYTNAQALKEDAELKLDDLSKPAKSYSADVVDLSNQSGYEILAYSLGDTIMLIDESLDTIDKQRIVKLTQYPDDHTKDTCELSNLTLTFEEMQSKINAAADIVNFSLNPDGTINLSQILNFEKGLSDTIITTNGQKGSVAEKIGSLEVNKITMDDADAKYIKIDLTDIDKANITEAIVQKMLVGGIIARDEYVTGEFIGVSMDASAIRTGTLDAGQIHVANLSAENINVKYINGQTATVNNAINNLNTTVSELEVNENLIRNAETLNFSMYGYSNDAYCDENGIAFIDENSVLLV